MRKISARPVYETEEDANSLFRHKSNEIKNLKHVKFKEKVFCLLIKIINQLAIMHIHNKNLIKHQLENVKF